MFLFWNLNFFRDVHKRIDIYLGAGLIRAPGVKNYVCEYCIDLLLFRKTVLKYQMKLIGGYKSKQKQCFKDKVINIIKVDDEYL